MDTATANNRMFRTPGKTTISGRQTTSPKTSGASTISLRGIATSMVTPSYTSGCIGRRSRGDNEPVRIRWLRCHSNQTLVSCRTTSVAAK